MPPQDVAALGSERVPLIGGHAEPGVGADPTVGLEGPQRKEGGHVLRLGMSLMGGLEQPLPRLALVGGDVPPLVVHPAQTERRVPVALQCGEAVPAHGLLVVHR